MRCTIARLSRAFAWLLLAIVAVGTDLAGAGGPAPSGRVAMAWHVTIAPSWFDPSTAPAQITPFGILYALHDSVVRATYGSKIASPIQPMTTAATTPAMGT